MYKTSFVSVPDSSTVAEDCFEYKGTGDEWQGKFKLFEETSSETSDEGIEDYVKKDDEEEACLKDDELWSWDQIEENREKQLAAKPKENTDEEWDWDVSETQSEPSWN